MLEDNLKSLSNTHRSPGRWINFSGKEYKQVLQTWETELNYTLSPKELEVVYFVHLGKSNHEISAAINISVQTVKYHLTNIYKILDINNRTSLAIWVHKNLTINAGETL